MAFNFFKKKEVIESNNNDKAEKDIVEDFGELIKNNSINMDNNDLTVTSFDSNFNEKIDKENNTMTQLQQKDIDDSSLNLYQIDTINDVSSVSENFRASFNESVKSTNASAITNGDNNTSTENNSTIDDVELKVSDKLTNNLSDNTETNDDVMINSHVESSNVQDINNYNYNPIIDNLENIQGNIKDSQDINIVLSNMHKTKELKEKTEENEVPIQKQSNNNPVDISMEDDIGVDPGYKRCPKCGQIIREDYKECFVCGTKL